MFRHRALLLILAIGFALRVVGSSWGLPGPHQFISLHPDEHRLIDPVARSLDTGELTPPRYSYGCLLFDLVYLTAAVFDVEPGGDGLHRLARLLCAGLGTATIALVYGLGLAIASPGVGRRLGIVSALLFAVAPGHVMHSHFATADVPATFFTAAALLLAARFANRPSQGLAVAGGVAAGLAAATKYPTGLVLVAVAAAILASGHAARIRWLSLAAAGAVAAFLVACPFLLTDTQAFLDDVYRELVVHPATGHGDLFADTGNGWWYQLSFNLPWLLTAPFALAGVAGLIWLRGSASGRALLWFAIPFFLGIGISQVRFMRYTLPLAPVLAVGAALLVDRIATAIAARRSGSDRIAVVVATTLLVAPAAFGSTRIVASFVGIDPRQQASEWLDANVAEGSVIGLVEVPGFRHPLLVEQNPAPGLSTSSSDAREWFLSAVRAGRSRYRFAMCQEWDVSALLAQRPELVVLSELDFANALRVTNPEAVQFLAALDEGWELIERFDSFAPEERIGFGPSPAPHDWLYPHPQIRVYRIRTGRGAQAPAATSSRSGSPSR